jgi:hypothetical protein
LSALFVEVPNQGSWVKGLLHVDARDLAFTEDKDGIHHGEVEVVSMLAGGSLGKPDYRSDTMTMRLGPAAYQAAMKYGISFATFRQAKRPGPYETKVVIRDNNSQEVGSASQFLEVPDLSRKELALSGIMMNGEGEKPPGKAPQQPAPQVAESDSGTGPAVRIFPTGSNVLFAFQIFNAKANQQNVPELDIQTRLFRDGKEVYAGVPAPFDPTGQSDVTQLEVEHRLTLGADLQPGEYVLQVVVTDKLAPTKAATVSQSTDFEIRP